MENQKFLHLTWDDIQNLTERVAQKIKESGFNPDLIIAVSRGGFDPARILCDQLGIRRLASVQIEAYDGMKMNSEPVIVLPVNANLEGKRALLVDDVSDSGASLLKGKQHLLDKQVHDVRVATLHIKPWSRYKPDYYAESVDAWVVYPWELKETLLEIAAKIQTGGLKGEEVKKRLEALGFKRKDVEKYLILKNI